MRGGDPDPRGGLGDLRGRHAITNFADPSALDVQGLLTDGTHSVTVELSRGGTVVFGASREMVPTSTFTPNGAFCPPVCRSASISL